MTSFWLNPTVPTALIVLWALIWMFTRRSRPVAKKMDRPNAKRGDLSRDGERKTSKTEMRVRRTIEKAGYATYPQGTMLCVGTDSGGKKRFFTPDIMIKNPYMVVEVDPAFWHGADNKVDEDIMRNKLYASCGLKIVRVRIAGTQKLSPNDVVIKEGDYDPKKHGRAVLLAVGRARFYPASHWKRGLLRR